MPGFKEVTKSLEGRYIKLRSNSSGKTWEGKVKRISIRDNLEEPARRILFEDGREVIAHKNFSFSVKQLG